MGAKRSALKMIVQTPALEAGSADQMHTDEPVPSSAQESEPATLQKSLHSEIRDGKTITGKPRK
jgi:hypothetical protein